MDGKEHRERQTQIASKQGRRSLFSSSGQNDTITAWKSFRDRGCKMLMLTMMRRKTVHKPRSADADTETHETETHKRF